jgi:hypothetical protein
MKKGIQHYSISPRFHRKNSLQEGKEIDTSKSSLCKNNGKFLILLLLTLKELH